MSFHSNLSRWAVSISASVVAVVGAFGPTISPVDAQGAQCRPRRLEGTTGLAGVPANIVNFAQRNSRGVRIVRLADIEQEGNQTIYELRGFRGNNCSVEVDVIRGNNLRLDEVEEQLPSLNQLPGPVRATLNSRVPGFRATLIERSTRPGGAVVYELEGTRPNGQAIEVDINANGTNLQIENAS